MPRTRNGRRPRGARQGSAPPVPPLPPPPRPSATPVLEARATLIGFALLLALAAALRFYGLAYRDLWFDELGAVTLAMSGDLWANEGGNPPLFFGLLRLWMELAGTSITAVRILPAIAGVAGVAALFWVAVELRLPSAVRWWGTLLLALSPLHLYYSQETRAYAWLILLVLVALGSFLRAVRTGDRRWWVAHALSIAAGLYTHNMMIPMAGAFWAAAVVLRLAPRQWAHLALTHGLAAAVYLPWLVRLREQALGDSHDWIVDLIEGASGMMLVWSTFEAFSPGGLLPGYVQFPDVPGTHPWAFLIFSLLGVAATIAGVRAVRRTGESALARSMGVLLIFTAAPVLFLLAYTWLAKPLYVAARYDVPALPAFLLLMAVGLQAFTTWARRAGRVAPIVPACAVLILCAGALSPKLALGNSAFPQHTSVKLAALLRTQAEPGDVLVALDIADTLASYAAAQSGKPLTVEHYPAAVLHHLGKGALNHWVMTHEASLRKEAAALAARLQGRRAWLLGHDIYDNEAASGFPRLKLLLTRELTRHVIRRDLRSGLTGELYVALLVPN